MWWFFIPDCFLIFLDSILLMLIHWKLCLFIWHNFSSHLHLILLLLIIHSYRMVAHLGLLISNFVDLSDVGVLRLNIYPFILELGLPFILLKHIENYRNGHVFTRMNLSQSSSSLILYNENNIKAALRRNFDTFLNQILCSFVFCHTFAIRFLRFSTTFSEHFFNLRVHHFFICQI